MFRKILTAIYSGCFQSFVFAFLVFLAFYSKENTVINKIKNVFQKFRERHNRFIFYFFFYLYLILNDTVFSRMTTYSPFSDVFGGWKIYMTQYSGISHDVFANILMFVPLTILLSLAYLKHKDNKSTILTTVLFSFCTSFFIETLQILFKKGTFQLADLFFNTIGGLIGGLIFIIIKFIILKGKTKNEGNTKEVSQKNR